MKKIISGILIGILITTQIGCAKPVVKEISAPLNEVQFGKDYKYTVKMKDGRQISNVDGDKISGTKNELIINDKQKKSLLNQDIKQINGTGSERIGSYFGKGLLVGSGVGALVMIWGLSEYAGSDDPTAGIAIIAGLFGAGVSIAAGGIIGALIPKHNKVQITPIVEPTANGVNAGANIGVRF